MQTLCPRDDVVIAPPQINYVAKINQQSTENNIQWWRHQMDTFSALLAICAGKSPVPGEFPAQGPVTRSFDVFFDLRINGWVNNREAGDLRRYRTHYDVIVMTTKFLGCTKITTRDL